MQNLKVNRVPQRSPFLDLHVLDLHCHTKRRIGGLDHAESSFGIYHMTPTCCILYNLWRVQITNLKSVSYQKEDWQKPSANLSFNMTSTKIWKDMFQRHMTQKCLSTKIKMKTWHLNVSCDFKVEVMRSHDPKLNREQSLYFTFNYNNWVIVEIFEHLVDGPLVMSSYLVVTLEFTLRPWQRNVS